MVDRLLIKNAAQIVTPEGKSARHGREMKQLKIYENQSILIENGKFCEEGSHNELLKQNGTYRMLFETQAKYYKNNLDKTEVAE